MKALIVVTVVSSIIGGFVGGELTDRTFLLTGPVIGALWIGEHLKDATDDVVLVSGSDKLHNAGAIVEDLLRSVLLSTTDSRRVKNRLSRTTNLWRRYFPSVAPRWQHL